MNLFTHGLGLAPAHQRFSGSLLLLRRPAGRSPGCYPAALRLLGPEFFGVADSMKFLKTFTKKKKKHLVRGKKKKNSVVLFLIAVPAVIVFSGDLRTYWWFY